MESEKIIAKGINKRPFPLFQRRTLIGVTTSRIILLKRPLLGGFNMIDIQWKDLSDVELGQNILPQYFGSRISFKHSLESSNFSSNINFDAASKMYKVAQKEEQAWEERRRIRRIEETRAAAGGTYLNTGTEASKEVSDSTNMDYQNIDNQSWNRSIFWSLENGKLKYELRQYRQGPNNIQQIT